MKRIYEFKCQECKEIFDRYVEYTQHSECPLCGGNADKIISAPRIDLEGYSGAFPGAADAWVRKRKQKLAQEKKYNSEE